MIIQFLECENFCLKQVDRNLLSRFFPGGRSFSNNRKTFGREFGGDNILKTLNLCDSVHSVGVGYTVLVKEREMAINFREYRVKNDVGGHSSGGRCGGREGDE